RRRVGARLHCRRSPQGTALDRKRRNVVITSKSRNIFETLPSTQVSTQLNVVAIAVFIVLAGAGLVGTLQTRNPYWVVGGVLLGWVLGQAPRVAQQWERAVILRLG